MVDVASIVITADSSQVATATQAVNHLNGSLHNASGGLGSFSAAARQLSGVFGALGLGAIASQIVQVNREMQSLRTSLETVTGSALHAKVAFEAIQAFAAKTPYSVQQVTDAFIKLKALGLQPSERALTAYGNTASAMGKDLNQMIEAVADASTGEFERLKEFGIKASKQGDDVKLTFQGVTTTVKNSSAEIQDYLLRIGEVNFAGGMDKQAKTINGALSNLGDSWDRFIDHIIGDKSENAISRWVSGAADALGRFDTWLNGASSSQGKIEALDQQINSLQKTIGAHNDNGMLGGFIDDLAGFDVNKQKNELDGLLKQRAALVGVLHEEKTAMSAITGDSAARVAAIAAENKALGDKFDLETRLKNLIEGRYKSQLIAESKRQGLDPNIALTAAALETNSGKDIRNSPKGAQGLLQIMPDTAGDIARQMGISKEFILKTAEGNIKAGVFYLKQQQTALAKQGKASLEGVLASYNAGPGNFLDGDYKKFKETTDYVKHGKQIYDALKAASGGVDLFAESNKAAKDITFEAVTAYELFDKAVAEASKQLADGAISYEGYVQKINGADDSFKKALQSTEKYQDAIKRQDDQWQQLIADANELDALRAGSSSNASLLVFAEQLKLAGMTTQEIAKQVQLQQQLDSAVAAHPNLDAGTVKNITAEQLATQEKLNALTQESTGGFSKAWDRAIENIQDSLGGALESAFNGKGLQSAADFAQNIKDVLFKAVSQSISAALIEGFKAGDWGKVFSSGLMALAGAAVGWLSKSNEAGPPSIATKGYSKNAYGTGAMAIADVSGRDFFETSTLETVRQWNSSIDFISNALKTGALKVWEASSAYVDKISAAFNGSALGQFLSPLIDGVKTAFSTVSAWGTQIWNGISSLFSSVTNLVSTGTTALNGINTAVSTGSGATAAGAGAAGSKVPGVGTAIAILKLGYDLFTISSNDMLTTWEQISHSLWAASDAMLSVALATFNPFVALAAGIVNAAGSVVDMFENGFSRENVSRLFLGPLASLLFPPRTPNTWMNTFSNDRGLALTDQRDYKTDQNGMEFWTRESNKGGFVGVQTAFGALELSIHEIKRFNEQELIPSYVPLLQTIKAYDNALGTSIQIVDAYYNQTGQTLDKFNAKLWDGISGQRIATKQDLSDMSTAAMVSDRFQGIGKILSQVDTVAGRTAGTWIKAFSDKLLKTGADNAEYNQTTTLNIEAFVAANLFDLTQLPLKLADLFVRSVKSVADGATQEQFEGQFNDFFGGFMIAKEGLKQAGIDMSDAVPGYLASLMDIGLTVREGANTLAVFAGLYKNKGDEFNRAFNDLMAQAKQGGYGKEQTSGYLSSYMTFANVANDLDITATNSELNSLASSLIKTAQASTQTANDVIDHAIADAKLTKISREAAVEQLRVAGTLDETTIASAQFGKALAEAQSKILGGVEYANTLGLMFGTTVGGLGIGFQTVTNLGNGLVSTFGDMANSMQFLDTWAKAVLSDDQYKSMSAGIARAKFNSAASAVGMQGLSIDQFKAYSQDPQVQANLVNLLGSTDDKNQDLAKSYVTLINAGVNLIDIEKQAAGSINDVATSTDALVDKFKDINTAFKAIGVSELQQQLEKIKTELAANNQSVVDSFIARGETSADRPLSEGQFLRNTLVAVDQAKAALKPLFDEFSAIGKTDVQKNMEGITTWYAETLQSVGNIALAYGITNQQAIDGITAIRDERIKALQNESSEIKKIRDYVQSLKVGDLSPTTPLEQLNEARKQFFEQISLANKGDVTAQAGVTGFADTYLKKLQEAYASGDQYKSGYNEVVAALDGVSAKDYPTQQIELATQQRDYLKAIADWVTNPEKAALMALSAPQTAGGINGGYAATSATAPRIAADGVGPLASMSAGANLLSTFNRLIGAGDLFGAADVAKSSGYSMPQVAGYVEQTQGIPAANVMDWLTQNGYAFADGGAYQGGLALVGEQGPELINFNSPGQVYTAPQTKSLLSSGDNAALIAEVKALREEIRQFKEQENRNAQQAVVSNVEATDRAADKIAVEIKGQTYAKKSKPVYS